MLTTQLIVSKAQNQDLTQNFLTVESMLLIIYSVIVFRTSNQRPGNFYGTRVQ